MSYDSEKKRFGREHIYVVELELDYCDNTFGVAPCTAVGSGDSKCYNTLQSCQDIPNFVTTTKVLRFCTDRAPHPIGINAIPCIESINISPSEIDIGGGLGVRASVSIKFRDFPHSDLDIDKYVDERTYIASDRGTFWTKLRARNPNYQSRPIRVLSGYLVNGVFDVANFQTRYYIVERMDVGGGSASITGKDPLKLASSDRAQVPKPSKGQLSANITSGATSLTLTPAGVGNSEYPASGYVAIKKEVMAFTRSGDVLTLTRAQYNTTATAHTANDTVQLCYRKNAQVNVIVKDLLENYAEIDTAFIPATSWQTEVDTWLTGLLDGIITKPMDVNKVLIELSEAMPHYLWWDERVQKIQLTALQPPPPSADVLDMSENLIANSVNVNDEKDKRISTVFVNFGQINPMEKIDEPGNYQQTYARVDTDSINKYGFNLYKVIYSRWISNSNKAAALQLAAKIGRRFSNIPRSITFELDAKDSDVWIGQSRSINHRDITDFSGMPVNTVFQITSAAEDKNYKYKGLEYVYGGELPEDEGGGDPTVDLIILGADQENINLRTIYESLFGSPTGSTKAKFIIETGVVIGSADVGLVALATGTWSLGATVTVVNKGYIVGRGGFGGSAANGQAAGDAINMTYHLTIDNQGIIGGGGGGGGGAFSTALGQTAIAGGGGGAGDGAGVAGLTYFSGDGGAGGSQDGGRGTLLNGGRGGNATGPSIYSEGGKGGDLGAAGQNGVAGNTTYTGGAAGRAIVKNGKVLTYINSGDIRGAVV